MGLGFTVLEGTRLHRTEKRGDQGVGDRADFPGLWPLLWQQEVSEACTSGARGGQGLRRNRVLPSTGQE